MSNLAPVSPDLLREGRKVFIALPWYRSASPLTTVALLNLFDKSCMGISISYGDAFIVHARNKLASRFLDSKFEWMLTIDDDMVLPCGNAEWFNQYTGMNLKPEFAGMNTLDRLLSHGKTLIGATYFGRRPGGPPVFAEGVQRGPAMLKAGPKDEIIPCKWVGTGCLLVHRTVFEAVEQKFSHLSRAANRGTGQWFTSSEHDLHQSIDQALNQEDLPKAKEILKQGIHRARIHSGLGMGEDVQFCVRATQSGHQPHVDLGLWCGHIGPANYPVA